MWATNFWATNFWAPGFWAGVLGGNTWVDVEAAEGTWTDV